MSVYSVPMRNLSNGYPLAHLLHGRDAEVFWSNAWSVQDVLYFQGHLISWVGVCVCE